MTPSSNMTGVFVTFDLGPAFDAARLTQLAQAALPKFQGMPELVSKTFTIDAEARQAVNFYVWQSEAAARRFFSAETLAWVTGRLRGAADVALRPGRRARREPERPNA